MMSTFDIIRAWKDEDYRRSLTTEQLVALPENPAGLIELTDLELAEVVGANNNNERLGSNSSCCPFSCN